MSPKPPLMKLCPHLVCCIIATVMLLVACKRNHPPTVPEVTGRAIARPDDTIRLSAVSTDRDNDLISYLLAWGDTSSADWSPDYPSGVAASGSHVYTDSGAYAVKARARDDKGAESDWSPAETLRVGFFPPGTPTRPAGPAAGLTGIAYEYSTRATSPYGESLSIQFDWGDTVGSWSHLVASDSPYIGTRTFDSSGLFVVRARAKDKVDRMSAWSDSLMVAVVAQEPSIPARPAGPSSVKVGTAKAYSTWSEDPNGDSILYVFDWNDGRMDTTALYRSGDTVSHSHAWSDTGAYALRAKSRDSKGNFSVGWSEALVVHVVSNHPPDAPIKPTHTGPDSVGRPEVFTTSATDPDGDSVRIKFYFADGGTPTYGPKVASGASYTDTVVYNTRGWKVVYAVATDGRDTSAWSAPDSIFINSLNAAPDAPLKPTHAGGNSVGQPVFFTTSATDPDGDSVQIKFYFADGGTPTYGPLVASGATFTDTVVYQTNGYKVVYAVAMDARDDTSAWSVPDSVYVKPGGVPYDLMLAAFTDSTVYLTWSAPVGSTPNRYVVSFRETGTAMFDSVGGTQSLSLIHDPAGRTGQYQVTAVYDSARYASAETPATTPIENSMLRIPELNGNGNAGYGWSRTTGEVTLYDMTLPDNADKVDLYVTDFAQGHAGPYYSVANPSLAPSDPGGGVPPANWRITEFTYLDSLATENDPLPRYLQSRYEDSSILDSFPLFIACHTEDGYFALVKATDVDTINGTADIQTWFQLVQGLRLIEH